MTTTPHESNINVGVEAYTSLGLGTRYKTLDMHHFAPRYKTYAESSDTIRCQMEHDAVIANVFREKGSDNWQTNIWHLYGVKKASFYKALKWKAEHPGRAWSGANIRFRGKITLLTESMEEELQHWIALSQWQSGGVEKEAVCRVGFALMASDD